MRRIITVVTLSLFGIATIATGGFAAPRDDQPSPIARGPHISGAVRYQPPAGRGGGGTTTASCSTPGSGNFKPNCHGTGRPVNETWIATNGSGLYVAGANDYNSYNGQGQNGFYWMDQTKTITGCASPCWNDAGPLDVFPHNTNNGAGDPGLVVSTSGGVTTAYYSSLFFNFNRCNVGGVELTKGTYDPANNKWTWGTPLQLAADSSAQFQDKPAIAADTNNVYVSWTQFGSCSGVGVTSPIRVDVVSKPTNTITKQVTPPGSTFSQGSSIVADNGGGFWVAWEEYPSSSATIGTGIFLAHYDGSGWVDLGGGKTSIQITSPTTFEDLSSPLSGFSFRDNSFPALTLKGSTPVVTWAAFDSSLDPQTQKGRVYEYEFGGSVVKVDDAGGHEFFPAIVSNGTSVWVSYSKENLDAHGNSLGTYDQYIAQVGSNVSKASTASSSPNADKFFSGQFIGDYNGMTLSGSTPHAIWTDLRGPDPNYATQEMDGMANF